MYRTLQEFEDWLFEVCPVFEDWSTPDPTVDFFADPPRVYSQYAIPLSKDVALKLVPFTETLEMSFSRRKDRQFLPGMGGPPTRTPYHNKSAEDLSEWRTFWRQCVREKYAIFDGATTRISYFATVDLNEYAAKTKEVLQSCLVGEGDLDLRTIITQMIRYLDQGWGLTETQEKFLEKHNIFVGIPMDWTLQELKTKATGRKDAWAISFASNLLAFWKSGRQFLPNQEEALLNLLKHYGIPRPRGESVPVQF